jgi:hypothetical protein
MSSSICHDGFKNMTSAATMGAHLRVFLNSSGNAALAGIDQVGLGTTQDAVLVSGDITSVNLFNRPGTRTMVASEAITAGTKVYAAASGKVSDVPSGPYIGIALETASGDGAEIEVYAEPSVGGAGLVLAAIAAGTDHENTTDEAVMNGGSYSIPANTLKAGDVFRVRCALKVTDNNSTDTLTTTLRLGTAALTGTAVIATAAVDSADNDVVYFDVDIVIRSIGASGKFAACGVQANGVPGTVTAKPFVLAETAIDTTVANFISVTSDWSVAHADNEVNLEVFNVSKL